MITDIFNIGDRVYRYKTQIILIILLIFNGHSTVCHKFHRTESFYAIYDNADFFKQAI